MNALSIDSFIALAKKHTVFDVRSPGEFQHAHIPGAVNLPLFNDEERAAVGTLYKQESREAAILQGLDYFGPKMRSMVAFVEKLSGEGISPSDHTVLVHCWRGGMRSAGVAWLLQLYGFNVYTLQGGYKAYRNWVLQQLSGDYNISVIGGNTGSGKTGIIRELMERGLQVIDLEGLASHKGSAFGNIGMPPQPSQEMFENRLAMSLFTNADGNSTIWMEDESQRIGDVNIPGSLWQYMIQKPVYFLEIPFENRLNHIVEEYGPLDRERLVNAVIRIRKRLGGLETQEAIHHLIHENVRESFRILLRYYDKFYTKSIQKKESPEKQLIRIEANEVDAKINADIILENFNRHQRRN
jgi:tRNA 2-selenouridine synthase